MARHQREEQPVTDDEFEQCGANDFQVWCRWIGRHN